MKTLGRIAALGGAAALMAACSMGGLPDAERTSTHHFPVRTHATDPSHHPIHGIDVSRYQGNIDYQQVKQAGVSFVWIKATEGGDRLDERFHQNWTNAKAAGIPRGAYHFAYWCRSLSEQADWFIRNVPVDHDALPPVLDVEWNFDSPSCPKKVPKDVAISEMKAFLNKIEAHYGKRPVIYADIPFHRDVLAGGELPEYPFWIRSVKDPPHERYPGRRWSIWQFTATGTVPGVPGKVDRNAFAGSRAQWELLVAGKFRPHYAVTATPAAATTPSAATPAPEASPAAPDKPAEGGSGQAPTPPAAQSPPTAPPANSAPAPTSAPR